MIPREFLTGGITRHPLRSLLTLFSVVAAVACVVSVLQATLATREQLTRFHTTIAPSPVLEIVAEDGEPFDALELNDLRSVEGVHDIIPLASVYASVSHGERTVRLAAVGLDPRQLESYRTIHLLAGRMPRVTAEVLLEKSIAERLQISIDQEIEIRTKGVPVAAIRKVTGILEFPGVGGLQEQNSLFLSFADGSRLNRARGEATSVLIVGQSAVTERELREAIRLRLPSEFRIPEKASAAELIEPTEILVNVSLNVVALLSVVAAIFISVNTFQISVRERQPLFALLRLIGATPRQIQMTLFAEALAFGIPGSILGVGGGIMGGRVISHAMKTLYSLQMPPETNLNTTILILGLCFGPVMTLISVWYPARVAAGVPPLLIIRQVHALRQGLSVRWLLMAGCLLLAISFAVLMNISRVPMLQTFSVPAIIGIQIAAVLMLPALVKGLSSLAYRVPAMIWPVESLLGKQQIVDNFSRSSLTVAVLFIVTAASTSIGNSILYVTGDIEDWVESTVSSDFLLRASKPRLDMASADTVSDSIKSRLAELDEVSTVDPVTFALVTAEQHTATMAIRQFRSYPRLPVALLDADNAETREKMINGQIVIGTVLAAKLNRKAGDVVRVRVGSLEYPLTIAAIAKEYTAGGLMILIDRDVAESLFPVPDTQVFLIRADDGQTVAVEELTRRIASEEGLIFQSLSDIRILIRTMVSGITNGLWLILVLSFFIAGFSIFNTLTMNVIEQTRYLGMLRVIGTTRSQVLRLFLIQAVVLSTTALIPGVLTGAFMSWITAVSFEGITDHSIPFRLDVPLFAAYPIAALALSVVAATLPSIRATRLRPLEAIHSE